MTQGKDKVKYWDVVKNELSGKTTGEILIYGDIGGFDWDTWTEINTALQFRADFKALEAEHEEIHVHINSHGGIVTEGLAISNIIQSSKSKVHTYIDGAAFSMAALIALSGHEVHMAKNGLLMIHNAWSVCLGNSQELIEASEELKKYDRSLALMIMDKTSKTEEEVFNELLDYKDHTFNSDECLALGLIDHIESFDAPEQYISGKINKGQYNKAAALSFKKPNQPKSQKEWAEIVLGQSNKNQPLKKEDQMNLEKTLNLIKEGKFNSVLSEKEITEVKEEISATLKEGEVITASDLAQAKSDLQEKINAFESSGVKVKEILGLEKDGSVVDGVKTLKLELAEANKKLEKAAPPAPAPEGPDPHPSAKNPLDDLPHNKKADSIKDGRTIQ